MINGVLQWLQPLQRKDSISFCWYWSPVPPLRLKYKLVTSSQGTSLFCLSLLEWVIFKYSWSTINSVFSHIYGMIHSLNRVYHKCERREYNFAILWEYLRIFLSRVVIFLVTLVLFWMWEWSRIKKRLWRWHSWCLSQHNWITFNDVWLEVVTLVLHVSSI